MIPDQIGQGWLAVAAGLLVLIPTGFAASSTLPAAAASHESDVCRQATAIKAPLSAPGGPFIHDACGRVVILHGTNAVYKVAPYELTEAAGKANDFTATDASDMASLGFDVVRLGIIWKGLEPGKPGSHANDPSICSPGNYGDPHEFSQATVNSYLDGVDKTVQLLASYGIYSLVDMHQDAFNEMFAGEGAPDWAVCTNDMPPTNTGNWSANYFTPAATTALEHFWDNDVRGGLQQEYDRVWAAVATHFHDNPWVLGYDLFNEPFSPEIATPGGNLAFDARLECFYTGRAFPGQTGNGHLPVVCPPTDPDVGLIPTIEHSDANHLIFYEPDVGNDFGQVNWIGPMSFPKLVLNFHDYCLASSVFAQPQLPTSGSGGASTQSVVDSACRDQEGLTFEQEQLARSSASTSFQPGGPAWFLSEWGGGCDLTDLAQSAALADENLAGWTYWQWKLYNDPTGSSNEAVYDECGKLALAPKIPILARPYAQALSGSPTSMSFDVASDRFELTYVPDHRISAPSIVFVPISVHYANGYCAKVDGAASPRGSSQLRRVPRLSSTSTTRTNRHWSLSRSLLGAVPQVADACRERGTLAFDDGHVSGG